MEGSNQFLGTERIGKLMQKYAIPCIISLLVGALYNVVDSLFVRHYGENALSAVSLAFPMSLEMPSAFPASGGAFSSARP